MEEEKRMAGDYVIFQAISVGAVEVVMGDNPNASPGERFMCALCSTNALFAQYGKVMVSDDYSEILEIYAQRIRESSGRNCPNRSAKALTMRQFPEKGLRP